MEFNDIGLALMIAFNAAFCLLLPRLITLNWGQLFTGNLNKASQLNILNRKTSKYNLTNLG